MTADKVLLVVYLVTAVSLACLFLVFFSNVRGSSHKPQRAIRQLKGKCPTCGVSEKEWCIPNCTALDLFERGM